MVVGGERKLQLVDFASSIRIRMGHEEDSTIADCQSSHSRKGLMLDWRIPQSGPSLLSNVKCPGVVEYFVLGTRATVDNDSPMRRQLWIMRFPSRNTCDLFRNASDSLSYLVPQAYGLRRGRRGSLWQRLPRYSTSMTPSLRWSASMAKIDRIKSTPPQCFRAKSPHATWLLFFNRSPGSISSAVDIHPLAHRDCSVPATWHWYISLDDVSLHLTSTRFIFAALVVVAHLDLLHLLSQRWKTFVICIAIA